MLSTYKKKRINKRTLLTEYKDNPVNGRKYLQIISLIRESYQKREFLKFNNDKTQHTNRREKNDSNMGRQLQQIFLLRRYTKSQQPHEKMVNTIKYQRNAKQNHSEKPPHSFS
jgi:hypothetical protein